MKTTKNNCHGCWESLSALAEWPASCIFRAKCRTYPYSLTNCFLYCGFNINGLAEIEPAQCLSSLYTKIYPGLLISFLSRGWSWYLPHIVGMAFLPKTTWIPNSRGSAVCIHGYRSRAVWCYSCSHTCSLKWRGEILSLWDVSVYLKADGRYWTHSHFINTSSNGGRRCLSSTMQQ